MSTSIIVARAKATGHHVLRLDGYSRTRDMVAAGDHIKSGDFRVGATTWRIKYYPNGYDKHDDDGWIALSLEHDGAAVVKVLYSFSLLNQAGKLVRTFTCNGSVYPSPADDRLPGWRGHNFIKRSDLERSEHLISNDGFAIQCDIDVMEELDVRVEETTFLDVPDRDLRAHLGRLLDAADWADVTFRVGEETLAAHSCVLAARSPVFKAGLLINHANDDPLREHGHVAVVTIVDGMDSRAFRALLHFMYTDTLPEMAVEDVPAVARQLLEAADRYQVERLKLVCADKLSRMPLDTNTAVVTDQQRQDHRHRLAGFMGKFVEFLDFLSFPGRERRCSLHSAAAPVSSTSSVASSSASTITVSEASGHHVLKVEGYSRTTMVVAVGGHISSGEFEVGGRTWRIKYYPNGRISNSSGSDYIAIYVQLTGGGGSADTDEPIHARLELSLLDHAGKPVPRHTYRSGYCTLTKSNGECGDGRFISKWYLERSEHLKDDRFAVRCNLAILVKETRVQPVMMVPPPALPRHLCQLLSSKAGADVTFEVGGETFAAHRCILAARSSVFRAELLGPMRERGGAGNIIIIQDMDAAVFRALLHFIYTDDLTLPTAEDATATAQHLLVAADRYGMERLKVVCEDRLCRHLDAGTAATTLALEEQHHCTWLKEAVLEFVCSSAANLRGFVASDGYQHLTASCPSITNELVARLAADPRFSPPTWTYRVDSNDARI